MTKANLKAGQITAKLRDAVPVEFYEGENEKAMYKNIDIPDSLKELETTGFEFITPENGKISFRLTFAPGVLPAEFPPARVKMTRAEKAAAKAAQTETVNTEELATAAGEAIEAATGSEVAVEPADEDLTPAIPEYRFNVTGDQRKALVTTVENFTGEEKVYKGAPRYAYSVGSFIIDRTGTLIGEANPDMLTALAEQGFTTEAE